MKSIAKKISLIAVINLIAVFSVNAQDGATLFKTKCAACHRVDGVKLVGPGLAGVTEKRSQEWLLKWIKDAPAFIASGDADAIAVFEENNKMPMIPFVDLADADILAILDYIKGQAPTENATAPATEVVAAPEKPIEYTSADIEAGKLLFTGKKRFVNGGPTCISCHNVTNDDMIPGGLLAKDLTNVYQRLGQAGVVGIVSAPPFPAMVNSFGNNPLTEEEVNQLAAFFSYADKVSKTQNKRSGYVLLGGSGLFGLLIILGLVSVLWMNRKKESTKKDIFARQLKGRDSIES